MPKKWGRLAELGSTLTGSKTKRPSKQSTEESFANAYLAVVQSAASAGVDLDAAVNRELRKRGIDPEQFQAVTEVPATRGRKIGKKKPKA